MYREPWFRIIEVHEERGRSMADIVGDVCRQTNVPLAKMKEHARNELISAAKSEAMFAIRRERPDLTSGTVAKFFNCESSSVRRRWRAAADSGV
jgi:hypothetical protein